MSYENVGTADRPFDDDHPASHPLIQTDAACAIPWRADGFEAVEVFIDPALADRAEDICRTMSGLCGEHRYVDNLNGAIQQYAEQMDLSVGVYERPRDRLSEDIVAVAFTVG